MAFAGTFTPTGAGRLSGFNGVSKVPGPGGLKVKFGRFYPDTDYPAGGYTAANLETICGFTTIEFIVPQSPLVDASGEDGFYVAWDGAARKLFIAGIAEIDGSDVAAEGLLAAGVEVTTGLDTISNAYVDLMVVGF